MSKTPFVQANYRAENRTTFGGEPAANLPCSAVVGFSAWWIDDGPD